MNIAIKRLGYFKACHSSAVQFNSIVFRVVVGFLADVPVEIIALVTSIEFFLNFILEIPAGFIADRYGRVKLAILGLLSGIVGLFSSYIALTNLLGSYSYTLFILQGVFIGFTRPLVSGSIEAFYQDSIKKLTSQEDIEKNVEQKSFTLSDAYGRYLTCLL